MKKDFFIQILTYDKLTGKGTFKIDFVNAESEELLEQAVSESLILRMTLHFKTRLMKTYRQLKFYFLLLKKILLFFNSYNKQSEKALDEKMKCSVWGVDYITVGEETIPVTKSKETSDKSSMCELIEGVGQRYMKIKEVKELMEGKSYLED